MDEYEKTRESELLNYPNDNNRTQFDDINERLEYLKEEENKRVKKSDYAICSS